MANITDVAGETFDYVIIGGGTAGLTIAARLTEDPHVSVAVLEAGLANLDDPNILIPTQFGKTFGNPKYDWAFKTSPQKNANGRVTPWPRGKGLGGSSAMNFFTWSRPPAEDIDAFAKLGNDGWSWKDFFEYSKLTENFHTPAAEQAALYPHTSVPANHGTSGPVYVSTPHHVHTVDLLFQQTCANKGLDKLEDAYGGDTNGSLMTSVTMDPKTWTRSYAATAYYGPNRHRTNLTVLTEAHVSCVLFAEAEGEAEGEEDITATGVEFIYAGTTYIVHAKKEVILSAGAINSPHILELSGIGGTSLLTSLSIPVKVDLPGVGENEQDHNLATITLELEGTEHQTIDRLRDEEFAKEQMILHASGQGMYRTCNTSFACVPLSTASPSATPSIIASLLDDLETRKGGASPGLKDQWDVQLEVLRNERVPDLEVIAGAGYQFAPMPPEPGRRYLTMVLVQLHPFSRGHVHAKSRDPFEHPTIETNIFDFDHDLESLVQTFKFVRSLQEVEPWKSGIGKELYPGPECETDEQIQEYLRSTCNSCWHSIGTCSMMPQEKQGVVDSKLKVYGTTNLRVADLSIVPLHVAAHTQTMAYVIGEKAADFIMGKSRV